MAKKILGKVVGADGATPYIGDNGNWFIGNRDTGEKANCEHDDENIRNNIKDNVDDYFTKNPVSEKVADYISNHQVVSNEQVNNAVNSYLTANPPTGGATNVQVEEAVNGYFERNDIDGRINELLIDVNATIGLSPENVTEYIEAHAEIEENCHYNNLGEKVSGDTYQCAKYEVTEGKYKVYGNTNSVANYPLLVQLDENNNVISVYHESDTNTAYGYDEAYSSFVMLPAYEVEILSNTKYLLVNGRVKSGSFSYPPKLEKETVKTSSEKSKDISFNPLYKKKIGLIGDSICYGNGYTGGYGKIIAENNNMTLQNLGVGSTLLTLEIANSTVITSVHGVRTVWTTLTSGAFDASLVDYSLKDDFGNIRYGTRTWNSSTHQYDYTEVKESEWNGTDELYIFRNSIPERLNYIDDDCDYIICEGGINDYLGALYLGTLTDEYDSVLDTHTVLGGTELLCRNLLEKFGAKKIGFIFTHKALNYPYTVSPNADGNLTYYHDEIKKVLRKYSIPVLDLYEVSGLNTGIDAFKKYTYNNDGVHPNKEGYDKFYVPKIEAWMKTL